MKTDGARESTRERSRRTCAWRWRAATRALEKRLREKTLPGTGGGPREWGRKAIQSFETWVYTVRRPIRGTSFSEKSAKSFLWHQPEVLRNIVGGGRHECSNVDRTTSLPVLCLRIRDSGKKGSTRREQPCDSAQVRSHAVPIGLPKILNLYWTVLSAFVTYFSETEYLST